MAPSPQLSSGEAAGRWGRDVVVEVSCKREVTSDRDVNRPSSVGGRHPPNAPFAAGANRLANLLNP